MARGRLIFRLPGTDIALFGDEMTLVKPINSKKKKKQPRTCSVLIQLTLEQILVDNLKEIREVARILNDTVIK